MIGPWGEAGAEWQRRVRYDCGKQLSPQTERKKSRAADCSAIKASSEAERIREGGENMKEIPRPCEDRKSHRVEAQKHAWLALEDVAAE